MAGAFFVQPCPICGRQLEVRVRYLGKEVACRHCGGQFEACDPEAVRVDRSAESVSDLERADALLSQFHTLKSYPK